MMKKTGAVVAVFLLLLCSCFQERKATLRIAEQYGLAYAPLQIMKEKKLIEKIYPEARVEWKKLANTAAIREAVLSGGLDAGFMGIPPFLIARDRGMKWKIATGLSQAPLGLVVPAGRYNSLADFPRNKKIALPQPGSIQHILLTMACAGERGKASALDGSLIAMKHPDGMNALLSGAVEGHFTSPPYLFHETDDPEFELLLSGEEAMGEPFTFIVGVVTEDFQEKNPVLYRHFLQAVEQAILFIKENPEETAALIGNAYSLDTGKVKDFLYRPGMVFETEVRGLERFIQFMNREGYLEKLITEGSVCF